MKVEVVSMSELGLKGRTWAEAFPGMVNKFAIFSALSAIGLFNILVYIVFVNPAGFLLTTSYLSVCGPNAANYSCYPGDPSATPTLPVDTKFLDRTLKQSGSGTVIVADNVTETNRTNISCSPCKDNVTTPTATTPVSSTPPLLEMADSTLSNASDMLNPHLISSDTTSSTAITESRPLKAPPVTALGAKRMQSIRDKAHSKKKLSATTKGPPLPTVAPPPQPRIDSHNYSYILNPEHHICVAPPKEQLLVILVCTSLANVESRQAIRNTWGSYARNSSTNIRLAFLLGATENKTLQESIFSESANYSDIIQESFLDTYNNLTLKSVMLLKWVTRYCPQAKFVLKVDDDMFINMRNLMKYLTAVRRRRRMLFGRLVRGARPVRARVSKWYAPPTVYKERVYPDYLSGTAYAMSIDVARILYNTSLHTPLFFLEDVFITGICARKAGVPRRHNSGFAYERRQPTGCAFRNAISGHKLTPNDLRKVWTELKQTNMTCR